MNRREAIRRTAIIMGYAVSASAVAGVFYSCKREAPSVSASGNFSFSADQIELLGAIAEQIIPKTDIPGAREVGVAQYINLIVSDVYAPNEQAAFLKGLKQINQAAQAAHQKDFLDCSTEEQEALVRANGEKAMQMMSKSRSNVPRPFFFMMKELTILGFFTSETIGKEYLVYDPIPGPYQGCIPYKEVGGVYAL